MRELARSESLAAHSAAAPGCWSVAERGAESQMLLDVQIFRAGRARQSECFELRVDVGLVAAAVRPAGERPAQGLPPVHIQIAQETAKPLHVADLGAFAG